MSTYASVPSVAASPLLLLRALHLFCCCLLPLLLPPLFAEQFGVCATGYRGADRYELTRMFHFMAVFSELALLPAQVFDALAPMLCFHHCANSPKHPEERVRSWVTALLRASLCCGSLETGVWMHPAVRRYSSEHNVEAALREKHRRTLDALLSWRGPLALFVQVSAELLLGWA